jgi:hypothetical protein
MTAVYIFLSFIVFLAGSLFFLGSYGNNFEDEDDDSKFPD